MLDMKEFRRLRERGESFQMANLAAQVKVTWDMLVEQGRVRLACEPDLEQYDDSYLETWGLTPRQLAHVRKELWDTIDRDGVWVYCSQVKEADGTWKTVDSIGSVIGSIDDTGYDVDLKYRAVVECAATVATSGLAAARL